MTQFVNCSPTDTLNPGDKFRATWTAGALTRYLWRGAQVKDNLDTIYNVKLTATGLAYPASSPYVAPDGNSGTLDLKISQLAGPAGSRSARNVSSLAAILDGLADQGVNLDLARLELVSAGEGSAAAQLARGTAADAADEATKDKNPLTQAAKTARTVAIVAAVLFGGWLLVQAGKIRHGLAPR